VARRLYRLTAPTLIAWGQSDRLMPPVYAERWKALIPHAEIAIVEGAGHMLPYERPDAFVAALTRFLG
jgi:pimeloyl-ACP methyl ester carboxylesterase